MVGGGQQHEVVCLGGNLPFLLTLEASIRPIPMGQGEGRGDLLICESASQCVIRN